MKLYKKLLKRIENGEVIYDNEKFAKDLEAIAEKHYSNRFSLQVVSHRREQFFKKQEDWLMVNTKMSVEQIIEFKYVSNLFK